MTTEKRLEFLERKNHLNVCVFSVFQPLLLRLSLLVSNESQRACETLKIFPIKTEEPPLFSPTCCLLFLSCWPLALSLPH